MKFSKWLKTKEDWAPSFKKGDIAHWINKEYKEPCPFKTGLIASLSKLLVLNYDKDFRVSVWGADDFGMDQDFTTLNEAGAVYHSLPKEITRASLEASGFKPF